MQSSRTAQVFWKLSQGMALETRPGTPCYNKVRAVLPQRAGVLEDVTRNDNRHPVRDALLKQGTKYFAGKSVQWVTELEELVTSRYLLDAYHEWTPRGSYSMLELQCDSRTLLEFAESERTGMKIQMPTVNWNRAMLPFRRLTRNYHKGLLLWKFFKRSF